MSTQIASAKNQLLDELWLKIVKKTGSLLYPRLKNKKMKTFTLTSDVNFAEIPRFVESKLTTKRRIVAWNYSHIKIWRLEPEPQISPAIVLGSTRFEDSIFSSGTALISHFPFDVINLDFSSQDSVSNQGRIEKEIESLEQTIRIQRDVGQPMGFALIYTTLLNSREIDCQTIISRSNRMISAGWGGLILDGLPTRTANLVEKSIIIETVLSQLASKYGFNVELEKVDKPIASDCLVCSVAEILKS